jgi:hypothetical protein
MRDYEISGILKDPWFTPQPGGNKKLSFTKSIKVHPGAKLYTCVETC